MKVDSERLLFYRKFSAIAIGNVMEWFDFASFGSLADVIGAQFFPPGDKSSHLIESLCIFGAAFVMRPLGGIVLGWIGDTVGRKRALEISIAMMLLPSFLIGCLPTFNHIGWWSTGILITLRMIQGLAVGGELIGAFVFTIEATNGQNRGFWGGSCKATGNLGAALGMGVGTLLRYSLTAKELYSWGWRLPFFIGLLFGILGIYLRSTLNKEGNCEGEEFQAVQHAHCESRNPAALAFRTYYREMFTVTLITAFWGVMYYSCFVWLVYFMSDSDLIGGDSVQGIWLINFCANLILVGALPLCGYLGDMVGRCLKDEEKGFRMVMQMGLLFLMITGIPAFMLLSTRTVSGTITGQLLLLIATALFGANLPAFMISQFCPNLRYTAVGIAYNFGHAIFSSTAAVIQTTLVLSSSSSMSHTSPFQPVHTMNSFLYDGRLRPAYYLIAVALMSYVALTVGVDYNRKVRREEVAKNMIPSAPTYASDGTEDEHCIEGTIQTMNRIHTVEGVPVPTGESCDIDGNRSTRYHIKKYQVLNQQYTGVKLQL